MKRRHFMLAALLSLVVGAVQADVLDDIKKKGSLLVGVSDDSPPFGQLDPKTRTVSGYDIDFAAAMAKRLGVKLVIKPITMADRIPVLQNGQVDMVVAAFTKNAERERQVDFSYGYFITGQKFVVKKGKVTNVEQLAKASIAAVKGTTGEKGVRKELPSANLVLVDDEPAMFRLLADGKVDAVTNDEPILAVLLSKMANKDQFEIPAISLSFDAYGVAVRKGEKRLLKEVNDGLVEMEKSGEAAKIFERWFGNMQVFRNFKISAS
ncbi:transporter substrate-binding domain-containing protein [Chitinivorax sp. B]|uniref:transporter substrate-binding domain-containing protein n=1 Tax=Chitinivorax sp. B TaxID=2502235 RepID=UPI0010F8C973|nr:transporter substrate-binding domain-containing protein [Chitinivorax sp. B]